MRIPLLRRKKEEELREEIKAHLQMSARERIERGASPSDAFDAAHREFGNAELVKDVTRDAWGWTWLEHFAGDFRYALRMLRKNPIFAAVAIISLALGLGANTAVFSLVNSVFLRPLPVRDADQIVALNNFSPRRMFPVFSYPNYRDIRDRNTVFTGVYAYRVAPLSFSHDGINERVWGFQVTGNYFDVLGLQPAAGRLLGPHDDVTPGGHPVAVISEKCWRNRFGGDPGVIGKNVIINGGGYTIVGVAPKGFNGTEAIASPEIFIPMAMQPQLDGGRNVLESRGTDMMFLQGRLKPRTKVAAAQASLDLLSAELEREFPDENQGKKITLTAAGLFGGGMRAPLLGFAGLLLAAVGLVLALACTNLANLLLARASERRKEIAVRLALGAGRVRLVRQLLTESVLLAFAGGVLGLLFASWLLSLLGMFEPPPTFPISFSFSMDYRVFVFAFLLSLAAGILFGLLPALQATRAVLVPALKDEITTSVGHRSWAKSGLIVLQVAMSLVLLIGGGLMLRALQNAGAIDLGFTTENAVELSFNLSMQGYNEARGLEFQKRLLERLSALPGVQSVGFADLVPVDLHFSRGAVFVEGEPPERLANAPVVYFSRVTPGYFPAMNTRILRGRDFSDFDNATAARVAIVNEKFAQRFWPGEDPIGKRLRLGNSEAKLLQVIGIVQNGKYGGLSEEAKPFVALPMWQSYSGSTYVVARTPSEPQRLLASIRSEVLQLDSHIPIANAGMLAEQLNLPLLPVRVAAGVLGGFGVLGLVLAAIGIYGVISHSAAKRTREIGIRVALGAQRNDVLKLVIGQGMTLALAGVGLGLLAAFSLTRLMKAVLFGVSATDPLVFFGIAALLAGVALLACYIPARRAARVDPLSALRYE